MAYDSNNVFAKILRGEIPCVKVYEDEATLAFMDIMPSAEGHTLVIPKEPAENILELSEKSAESLIRTTRKIARAVKKGIGCPGIMVLQLNGGAAGQSVFHVHFHIVPRHVGLEVKLHGKGMVDPKTLVPVAEKIKAALE